MSHVLPWIELATPGIPASDDVWHWFRPPESAFHVVMSTSGSSRPRARRAAAAVGTTAVIAMAVIGSGCAGNSAGESPQPAPQEATSLTSVWESITSWVSTEYSVVSSVTRTIIKDCQQKLSPDPGEAVCGIRG